MWPAHFTCDLITCDDAGLGVSRLPIRYPFIRNLKTAIMLFSKMEDLQIEDKEIER